MSTEEEQTPQTEPQAEATPTQIETGPEPGTEQALLDDRPAESETPAQSPLGEPLTAESLTALLPEGAELDEGLAEPFLEAINGAESREDLAKNLLEFQSQMAQTLGDNLVRDWHALQEEWKTETRNHPEIGGANYKQSLATALSLIDTYAEDAAAFKQMLSLSGAGNSVHMVQFLNKLDSLIPKEPVPANGDPAPTEQSRAEKLFGSTAT